MNIRYIKQAAIAAVISLVMGANAYAAAELYNSASYLSVDSFTTYADNDDWAISNTGGLEIKAGAAFNNNNFDGNSTAGGAAVLNKGFALFEFNGAATFTGNSYKSGNGLSIGGAIANRDNSIFRINNGVTFSNNSSISRCSSDDWAYGGAIGNHTNSVFIINGGAIFNNNIATSISSFGKFSIGGAISNSINADFTINGGATFTGNRSEFGDGGAIWNYNNYGDDYYAHFTINGNSTFSNNYASVYGGAIYNYDAYNKVTIFNINDAATFTGNSSGNDGGAIYNNGDFTMSSTGTFTGNSSGSDGGAIYNRGDFTMSSTGTFTGNSSGNYGGAIYNNGDFTMSSTGTFTGNTASGYGGAIDNGENFTIVGDATFGNNTATLNNGGAIYNSDDFRLESNATFTSNRAGEDGGAIINRSGFKIARTATFTSNTAGQYGGAVYNHGTFEINGRGVFNTNEASVHGGGIYNTSGTVTINQGAEFRGNIADHTGGAIFNAASFTINKGADFSNNISHINAGGVYNTSSFIINDGAGFTGNTADNTGGAIVNTGSGNLTINGGATFTGNAATAGAGGAVHNIGTFTANDGAVFTNNTAGTIGGALFNSSGTTITGAGIFTGNTAGTDGGAIYNTILATISDSVTFENNTATAGHGGAIYNTGTFTANDGAIFTGNIAGTSGGAIYSDGGVTTLIADNYDVAFTGNTANGLDNAIYLKDSSILNLNASDKASVIFNDGIASEGNGNVINLNATNAINGNIRVDAPNSGEIVLNADMSGFGNISGATGNTVNLYGGTLSVGQNGTFFDRPNFTAFSGSTLNLINNKFDRIALNNANISGMNMKIDVDIASHRADTISANSVTNNNITLSELAITGDEKGTHKVTVDPSNKFNLAIGAGAKKSAGQIYMYDVTSNEDGSISLSQGGYNPVLKAAGATQQSAYLNSDNINSIAFNRVEEVFTIMDNIRTATGVEYGMENKVALLEGVPSFSTLYGRLEEGSVWFRPFSNKESIEIDSSDVDIDSVSHGIVFGFDSGVKKLRRGFKGMSSAYLGYLGSNQDLKDVDIHQDGGFLGLMGALYKGNFYTTLSANAGGMGVQESIYGSGAVNYGMFSTSVSNKIGYTFHLPFASTLQLNNQLTYNLVNTQDYINPQGTSIKSDPLHTIQLMPGVKISKNIGGWQPYLSSSMVFNALNESEIMANEVVLPESSLGTYLEYGFGIQRNTGDDSTGFMQAMVRNGSRKGINLQCGFKMPVGEKTVKPELVREENIILVKNQKELKDVIKLKDKELDKLRKNTDKQLKSKDKEIEELRRQLEEFKK